MNRNQVLMVQDVINMIRAISAVNKEDLEKTATQLKLESSIQLNILWIVYCKEGARITDIADWTFWHTSSIVIHVKKLMDKGYVSIEKSDTDGRVVNVYMTEAGCDLIRKSYELIPDIFKIAKGLTTISERYSPAVTQLFIELLEYLATELQGEEKVGWLKTSSDKVIALGKQAAYLEENRKSM